MFKSEFLDETDFWRTITIGAGALITALGTILLKIATFFLRKKNDKLERLDKEVREIRERVSHIESCLIIKIEDGSEIPLGLYVQKMSHDFSRADEKYSNILDLALDGSLDKHIYLKNNGKV